MKGLLRIDEIFAFVALDTADMTEGVTGFLNPLDGTWLPMVCADRARVDQLMPMARKIARDTGMTIRLIRFSTRDVLEEIKP